MNIGEEKEMMNVLEKKEMGNASKVTLGECDSDGTDYEYGLY